MKNILILASLATMFAACTKEEGCNRPNDPQPLTVEALMGGLYPGTKTSDDGSNATWLSGDIIGVFCAQSDPAANNQQYTYSGSAWNSTPIIYWNYSGVAHKFYAYSPYASGSTSTAAVVPTFNTQTGTSIASSQNLLFSNNLGPSGITKATNNGTAALTFVHALTLVQLNITVDATVALPANLTSAIITGISTDSIAPSNSGTTLNLTNGVFRRGSTTSNIVTVTPGSAQALSTSTPVTLYILILPGTYTPTLTLQYSISGSTPSTSTLMGTSIAYAQNTKYVYTVTIARTGITITASTPIPWLPGGTTGINPIL